MPTMHTNAYSTSHKVSVQTSFRVKFERSNPDNLKMVINSAYSSVPIFCLLKSIILHIKYFAQYYYKIVINVSPMYALKFWYNTIWDNTYYLLPVYDCIIYSYNYILANCELNML